MNEGALEVHRRLLEVSAHTDDPDAALDRLAEGAGQLLLEVRSRHADVQARLVDEWGEAFDYFELLVAACLGSGLAHDEEHAERARRDGDTRSLVLQMLLARASLAAGEMLALMRAGFGPGALGLWARLHEARAAARFVAEHDRDVASRFVDFDRFHASATLFDYAHYAAQRGWEPYPAADDRAFKSRSQKLRKRYEPFAGEWDWARESLTLLLPGLGERSVLLSDIEEAVGLAHLRPLYEIARAGPHPDLERAATALAGAADPVMPGPDGNGTSLAGAQASPALYDVAAAFLGLHSDRESNRVVPVLERMAEGTAELFRRADGGDDPDEGDAEAAELA